MEPYDDQSSSQLFTVQIDSALTPVEFFSEDLTERLVAEPVLDGKYRVIALIGKGGMGAVYRAHHLRLGKDVALKTFLLLSLAIWPGCASSERPGPLLGWIILTL